MIAVPVSKTAGHSLWRKDVRKAILMAERSAIRKYENKVEQTYGNTLIRSAQRQFIHMYAWTYGNTNVWTYGCTNVWTYERVNVWTYECMNVWTSECLNVWTFEWSDAWTYWCINVRKYWRIDVLTYWCTNVLTDCRSLIDCIRSERAGDFQITPRINRIWLSNRIFHKAQDQCRTADAVLHYPPHIYIINARPNLYGFHHTDRRP